MRKNEKLMVFILMVMLVVSMITPVFADDSGTSGGAVEVPDPVVTEDAIDAATEGAVDIPTNTAVNDNGNQNLNILNDAKADLKKVKAVDTQIPGLKIEGDNFNLEEIAQGYILTVTRGPITISGSTTGAVNIDILPEENTTITLDNLNVPDTYMSFYGNGDPVNLIIEGSNRIGFGVFADMNSYDSEYSANMFDTSSSYKIVGRNGASLIGNNSISEGGETIPGGFEFFSKSFTFENLKLAGPVSAVANILNFLNVEFDIDLMFPTAVGNPLTINSGYINARDDLTLNGCKGEMRYPYYRDVNHIVALASQKIAITMNEGDTLSTTSVASGDLRIDSVYNTTVSAIQSKTVPTLNNTTITTPVNGVFNSFIFNEKTYFSVFDSSGQIAENVVFSGNETPENDKPVETKDKADNTTTEPKTSDSGQPWALIITSVIALITLMFVTFRRQYMSKKIK